MSLSSDAKKVKRNGFKLNCSDIVENVRCLECDASIKRPKKKFCCRQHKNMYNRRHRYKDRYTVKHRGKNPENFIKALLSHKHRREQLSLSYLMGLFSKQGGKCSLTGRDMTNITGKGKVYTNISIDRIDSDKGYVEGNVQLVCYDVNIMKNCFDQQYFKHICKKVIDHDR